MSSLAAVHPITLVPIGRVTGGRAEPRDDGWAAETARIELDPERFGPEALAGLDAFSHVEVVFHFHLVPDEDVEAGARRPRGNPDWPEVGIFAQRGKDRPNRLGVSICRLRAVDGLTVTVEGLDAVDGSPVLDLKPVMQGFLPGSPVTEPEWSRKLMRGYWFGVPPRRDLAPGQLYAIIDPAGDAPDVFLAEVVAVSDDEVRLMFFHAPDPNRVPDETDPAQLTPIRLHDKLEGPLDVDRDDFDDWDAEPVRRLP